MSAADASDSDSSSSAPEDEAGRVYHLAVPTRGGAAPLDPAEPEGEVGARVDGRSAEGDAADGDVSDDEYALVSAADGDQGGADGAAESRGAQSRTTPAR